MIKLSLNELTERILKMERYLGDLDIDIKMEIRDVIESRKKAIDMPTINERFKNFRTALAHFESKLNNLENAQNNLQEQIKFIKKLFTINVKSEQDIDK